MANDYLNTDDFDLVDDDELLTDDITEPGHNYSDDDDQFNDIIDDPDGQYASEETEELIINLLKERGINDPTSIKFEGEDGIIRARSWNDLTAEEQQNILNGSPDEDPDTDLDDSEIDLINAIRESGLSVEDYLKTLNNTNDSEPEYHYAVDDLTDDELYILDLETKVGDLSEDDAANALALAKQNSDLYEKQIKGIRQEYKNLEQQNNERKEQEYQQQQNEAFNQFAANVGNSINGLNSFGSLDIALEDEDKEELADFILGRDQTGVSYFGRALNDPDTLVRMAWFALHGEDTFNEINNYMSNEIKKAAQNGYNKGLSEVKNSSRVIINKNNRATYNPNYNTNQSTSIDDLD